MEKQVAQQVLHAVILTVPGTVQAWVGRRRVMALSRLARAAARLSTRRSGGVLGRLEKNRDGVPQPSNGWYWSIAHKPLYVAGVAGPGPLGIDIEPVHPRTRRLFNKIADHSEWRLGDEDEWHLFFRFWTAKEAVLKAVGMGLKGLSHCRVIAVEGPGCMTLDYKGGLWTVRQDLCNGHMAAVASKDFSVDWGWPEGTRTLG